MKISIVIPVYNSEKTLKNLVLKLIEQLNDRLYQIILVNDSSKDNSHEVCVDLHKDYSSVITYLQLGKNFGEHNAVMAGLNYVKGDCAVIMDDDFQNPPSTVTQLVDYMEKEDCDVVYSYYDKKKHSLFRNIGSKFNDRVASILLKKPKNLYLSSFKCINRYMVDQIIQYQGPYPYIDGLIFRSTNKVGKVKVEHSKRQEGESGYTLRKLIRLWLNMSINFSILPLRIASYMGILISFLGVLFAIVVFIEKMLDPNVPIGWSSTVVIIMIFSGVQLLMLGVMGEYLGSMFLSLNKTPQFSIREKYLEGNSGD